jgi:CBS domain-containing protein
MTVQELMTENPDYVTSDDSCFRCAQIMARRDVGVVPVCESRDTRRLVGVVTDRDIAVRLVAERLDPASPASEIMTPSPVSIGVDATIEHARTLMEDHQIRRLIVVDEHGSLVGVVSTADLAREIAEPEVGETLHAISQPAPTLNTK